MGLYVITWLDKAGGLPIRMATREKHLAYVADHAEIIRSGGPYLGPNGDLIGTLIIIEVDSIEDARAFHAADPYTKAGLFDHSEVLPWRPVAGPIR